MCEKELQRLVITEKEISEIKKSTALRLTTLEHEILEIRKVLSSKLGKQEEEELPES